MTNTARTPEPGTDRRDDAPTDRRRARGDDRRRAIAEAVIAVIGELGIGGVTHRRVATAAGVPLGSTTYYYETLTDLLVAGMTLAVEHNLEAMGQLGADLAAGMPLPRALAEWAADLATEHRSTYLSECELYLAAAREPSLRAAARSLTTATVDALRPYVASDAIALSLVHSFDGILFEALLEDEPPTVETLLPLFAPLVAAFQP